MTLAHTLVQNLTKANVPVALPLQEDMLVVLRQITRQTLLIQEYRIHQH